MNIKQLFDSYHTDSYEIKCPYLIAEVGVNHECDMNIAYRLIDEAKEGGADAIKFQAYKAETIASKYSPAYWDLNKESTSSQYELFKKYDKFWKNEFEQLKVKCDQVGIEFLCTPFDVVSAEFLNDLMDVYKISSSDITNKPFIEYICSFGKPIILSTGASYLSEVQQAVEWIEKADAKLALLHCILNYPTKDTNANLGMIKDLQKYYPDKIIGYSDHTLPGDMRNLEVATLLGAQIIEKHFTHDKSLPGNDHYHAMDKDDLKIFFQRMDVLLKLMGDHNKHPLETENISRNNARRSLVAACEIPSGKVIEKGDLTYKRPAYGISPSQIEELIGLKSAKKINQDTVLKWNMFND